MRERLALLREYLKNRLAFGKNKKTRKGFILTMVALVEVLAISVVSVSAWVETISTITIKAEGAKIDNYVYTNADIGSGDGYSNKIIDLTKYFRAAGVAHEVCSAHTACEPNLNVEAMRVWLDRSGIESRPLWKPMHKQPVYKDTPAYTNGVSEQLFKQGLCLPSGPMVTEDDVRYIVAKMKEGVVG